MAASVMGPCVKLPLAEEALPACCKDVGNRALMGGKSLRQQLLSIQHIVTITGSSSRRAMRAERFRVFFDGCARDRECGYLLVFDQSVKDLKKIEFEPREGMAVVLYDPSLRRTGVGIFFGPNHRFRTRRAAKINQMDSRTRTIAIAADAIG